MPDLSYNTIATEIRAEIGVYNLGLITKETLEL